MSKSDTTPKRKPSKAKERRVRREGAAAQFARVKVGAPVTPQFEGECQDFRIGAYAYLDGWSIDQCRSQWQRVGWAASQESWRGFMQNK